MNKGTILIVDDIATNRDTLEALLDYPELELHYAADGVTALAMAAQLQPDLILLDIMMPGMDGFEVCTRLRADPQIAEVPVIMVTSLDDRASRLRGIEAGADDFVTKPFDRAELRARIGGILRLNRFRRMQEASERIQAQAALIDLAPDAIIVCDLGQRITHWNPAAERLYGWRAEEAIGRRADELLLQDERTDTPGFEALANDGWRCEVSHITREKKKIIVESHRKLLRHADGRPKALLMINTDLTEKKRLEAHSLRSQRLESIGTLAGGIAHDLNNVLSPIMLSVEVMRMNIPGKDNRDLLDTLEVCAQRGSNLVRQILAFARGTGNAKSEVQLRHLLDAIVKMLRGAFPSNIEIRTKVPGEPWPVIGNATQLDQVLMNLCVNARDAMPGGGRLSVSLENATLTEADCLDVPSSQPGTYVCLSVADTGTGMPPEVAARIFDAFYTTKAEGKGTGLGLATVQTVVQGHDGFLTVESKEGSGTCFRVYLPAIPVCAEAACDPANAGELPRGRGECVLVVDDEAAITETTAALLERFGYKALTAADGLEALRLFDEHGPAIRLVITDTEMPQIGGPALAQILHELASGLPILLMSGAEEAEGLIASGYVTEFVKKPFNAPELLRCMRRILGTAERGGAD